MQKSLSSIGILTLLLFAVGSANAASYPYTVTDLGIFNPQAINSSGQVVGVFNAPDTQYAILYSDGKLIDLGNLGSSQGSYAFDINDMDQIVGYAGSPDGKLHAFLYSNGSMSDLGTLGGSYSGAYGINNSGQIVGLSRLPDGTQHAFFYDNGMMNDLGAFGGLTSIASDINASGKIIGGYSYTKYGEYHSFLYDNGVMTDIGDLGGSRCNALAINDYGQIVGFSRTANYDTHAFIYSDGIMKDINGSNIASSASGINNSGQVVGFAVLPTRSYAFLYSNGDIIDLNTLIDTNLGVYLDYAFDINDSGQIVALGHYYKGDKPGTAFLLTPIPEPSSFLLLCLGISGFLALAWQQRRAGRI
jgi:probable HAF family extracellular repeat protein